MIQIQVYTIPNGKAPYEEWVLSLDRQARARVTARLGRIQNGNFGDIKSVGDGVFELWLDFGPGYRVYFGREGAAVVVLLGGGDKGTQARDIIKAKGYWHSYISEGG